MGLWCILCESQFFTTNATNGMDLGQVRRHFEYPQHQEQIRMRYKEMAARKLQEARQNGNHHVGLLVQDAQVLLRQTPEEMCVDLFAEDVNEIGDPIASLEARNAEELTELCSNPYMAEYMELLKCAEAIFVGVVERRTVAEMQRLKTTIILNNGDALGGGTSYEYIEKFTALGCRFVLEETVQDLHEVSEYSISVDTSKGLLIMRVNYYIGGGEGKSHPLGVYEVSFFPAVKLGEIILSESNKLPNLSEKCICLCVDGDSVNCKVFRDLTIPVSSWCYGHRSSWVAKSVAEGTSQERIINSIVCSVNGFCLKSTETFASIEGMAALYGETVFTIDQTSYSATRWTHNIKMYVCLVEHLGSFIQIWKQCIIDPGVTTHQREFGESNLLRINATLLVELGIMCDMMAIVAQCTQTLQNSRAQVLEAMEAIRLMRYGLFMYVRMDGGFAAEEGESMSYLRRVLHSVRTRPGLFTLVDAAGQVFWEVRADAQQFSLEYVHNSITLLYDNFVSPAVVHYFGEDRVVRSFISLFDIEFPDPEDFHQALWVPDLEFNRQFVGIEPFGIVEGGAILWGNTRAAVRHMYQELNAGDLRASQTKAWQLFLDGMERMDHDERTDGDLAVMALIRRYLCILTTTASVEGDFSVHSFIHKISSSYE